MVLAFSAMLTKAEHTRRKRAHRYFVAIFYRLLAEIEIREFGSTRRKVPPLPKLGKKP